MLGATSPDPAYSAEVAAGSGVAPQPTLYLQRTGHPTYRLVRYPDDLVLLARGTREQPQALLDELAERVEALASSTSSRR